MAARSLFTESKNPTGSESTLFVTTKNVRSERMHPNVPSNEKVVVVGSVHDEHNCIGAITATSGQ